MTKWVLVTNFLNHSAYEPKLKEIGGQCLDPILQYRPEQSRPLNKHDSRPSDKKVKIVIVKG